MAQLCGATAMSDLGYFALGLGLLAVYLAAMAAVLFGAAGTLAVSMFWAYLALFAVLCVGASAAVYLQSPDLLKERVRPGEGEQHRVSVRALNLLMFVQLLLAGLDVGRLHWSATVQDRCGMKRLLSDCAACRMVQRAGATIELLIGRCVLTWRGPPGCELLQRPPSRS
jgi:hypothetical protein